MEVARKRKLFGVSLIFAINTFLLITQFSKVMIYYDDYGYYSLTYLNQAAIHAGSTFSLAELAVFLKEHYIQCNGRLLYFAVWLFLYYVGGLKAVQIGAAIIVSSVLFLCWKIISKNNEKSSVFAAFLICALYWLLSITLHRQGTYWFAAFFHYVTPLIPFLGFQLMYFYSKDSSCSFSRILRMSTLVFVAAFSQEQWAVTTIFFAIFLLIRKIAKKMNCKEELVYLGAAIIGASIVLLSPGIIARGENSVSDQNAWRQIVENIFQLLRLFFGVEERLFILVLLGALLCISIYLFREIDHQKDIKKVGDCCCMVMYVGTLVVYFTKDVWVREVWATDVLKEKYLIIAVALSLIVLTTIQVTRFYVVKKSDGKLIIFYSAILSIACLSVVSELPNRIMLLPTFTLFILVVDGLILPLGLKQEKLAKIVTIFICIAIAIAGGKNGFKIYAGYSLNKEVHVYNDGVLRETSEKIAEGEKIDRIYLKKVPDILYGCEMVYYDGFEYMKKWMDNYYILPPEVEFVFLDSIPENGVGSTLTTCAIQSGYYFEDGWASKESEYIIRSGGKGEIIAEVYFPGELQGNEEIFCFVDQTLVLTYALNNNSEIITIPCPSDRIINLALHSNFEITPENGDQRELSFILSRLEGQ